MTDNNYQASITKLQALHSSAIKSEDDRSFFSHLYRYLEFVCDNSALEANAWRLFGETYLHDHEADKDNPDFQKLSNMDLKFEGLEKLFSKVLSDYRGGSRVYYSWLFLYIFYYFKNVSPDTIATFGKNMPDAETSQSKLFSAKLQHELKSASFPLDMSGNDFVKRSDFSLYLEVFHQDFIDLLQTPTEQTSEKITYVGNATIGYMDYMTYVTLPNDRPLKLRKKDIKHNSGYDYFLKYMFDPKNEGELITGKAVQTLHIKCEGYSDVGDVLRQCGFNKYLKQVFMPKHDSTFFKYKAEAPITQQQVDDIKRSLSKIKQ